MLKETLNITEGMKQEINRVRKQIFYRNRHTTQILDNPKILLWERGNLSFSREWEKHQEEYQK